MSSGRPLLGGPGEWMTAELAAKRVADLGDDLDLGRMIKLRIFEWVDGVLAIDRVGRQVDKVGRIMAE